MIALTTHKSSFGNRNRAHFIFQILRTMTLNSFIILDQNQIKLANMIALRFNT